LTNKKRGKTRLKDLVVNEVSLVDKGANGKRFLLTKAADAAETEMTVETTIEPTVETPVETPVEKSEEPVVKAPVETPVEKAEEPAAEPVIEAAPVAEPVDVEKAVADRLVEIQKAHDAKLVEIQKAHDEAIAKAAAEREVLEKRLADEQEAKEVTESVQKAVTLFKNLPAKPDVLGPDLRKVRKALGDEVADRFESLLKGLDTLVKPALDPVGVAKAEESSASAWEEIQKQAKAKAKAENMSEAQAVDAVLRADSKLYAAYEAEKTQR
jgi:hypothetical protein